MTNNKHVRRIHGLMIMIIVLGFFLFVATYNDERQEVIKGLEQSVELILDGISEQLDATDRLYYALELYADEHLKAAITEMHYAYKMGDLNEARLALIKGQHKNVDLYVINKENVIEYTTLAEDRGLDFSDYIEYSVYFDALRFHKEYVSERIDIALKTDKIMKYSYHATEDGQYILDASYDMESFDAIQRESSFNEFSSTLFLNNQFVKEIGLYESYNDLEARPLKIYPAEEVDKMTALQNARKTGEISSYITKVGQYEEVTYFIPYFIEHGRRGNSVFIIKFTYTNQYLLEALNESFMFFGALLIIFLVLTIMTIRYYNGMIFKPIVSLFEGFVEVEHNNTKIELVPYGIKPLRSATTTFNEMIKNIDRLIEEKEESAKDLRLHLTQSEQGYLSTVTAMANTIDAKDQYTGGHCERVMQMSIMLAEFLKLPDKEQKDIMYASVLHDIGKIGIEDAILNKKGRFTSDEYEKMKKHPEIGYEIINTIDFLQDCGDGILYHHERIDGNGYPSGLKGDDIPFIGRLLAITDAFDAMTSRRIYKETTMTVKEAFNELEQCSGSHFDTVLVLKFKEAYIQAFGTDLNQFADEIE